MRILANENFPGDAVAALRLRGHDVVWVRDDAPGSRDREILEWARADDRILITFDKDFGELAFQAKLPASSGIILFRIRLHLRRTLLGPLWQRWTAEPIGRGTLPLLKMAESA